MQVSKTMALAILPILQNHAADMLARNMDPRAVELAQLLRHQKAGGNAIEGLNQNIDDDKRSQWDETLDTFWRVLVSFEENALGGHIIRGGAVRPFPIGGRETEQPYPWMLHAAAQAIQARAAGGDLAAQALTDTAEVFLQVSIPPYRHLRGPGDENAHVERRSA